MADFAATIAELARRVSALEARDAASLRFGRVTGVEGGAARVQLDDADGVVTRPLSTLQNRVLKDQDIKMPDIGEPVAILTSGQGDEQGFCLGAAYSHNVPDPGRENQEDFHQYADGTSVRYDRKAHLHETVIKGKKTEYVAQDITTKTDQSSSLTAKKKINIEAGEEIILESTTGIRIKAPVIFLSGAVVMTDPDGNAGEAVIHGSLIVRSGAVSVPDSDVSAGSVSLRAHVHEHSGGDGLSGKPQE